MGFDALFFARLDHGDKDRRVNEKELEFIWEPNSQSLGKDINIFTHVLWNHYSAPGGFNMYMTGGDQPFIIDKDSEDFNAESRAQDLINQINDRA
jgi:lysosomal alpha-mannosidase